MGDNKSVHGKILWQLCQLSLTSALLVFLTAGFGPYLNPRWLIPEICSKSFSRGMNNYCLFENAQILREWTCILPKPFAHLQYALLPLDVTSGTTWIYPKSVTANFFFKDPKMSEGPSTSVIFSDFNQHISEEQDIREVGRGIRLYILNVFVWTCWSCLFCSTKPCIFAHNGINKTA